MSSLLSFGKVQADHNKKSPRRKTEGYAHVPRPLRGPHGRSSLLVVEFSRSKLELVGESATNSRLDL